MSRAAEFLLDHRLACLAGVLLLTVVFASAAARLPTDFDIERILPVHDPERAAFEAFKRDFDTYDRDALLVVVEKDIFRPETLRDLQRITERMERVEGIEEVVSLTNVEDVTGTEDSFRVGPLVKEVPRTPAQLARLRAQALGNPLLRGRLISDDGQVTAVICRIARRYNYGDSSEEETRNLPAGRTAGAEDGPADGSTESPEAGGSPEGGGAAGGTDAGGTETVAGGGGAAGAGGTAGAAGGLPGRRILDAARERERIARTLEALAVEFDRPGRAFFLGGVPVVRRDYVNLTQRDTATFMPLVLGLLLGVLLLVFRSLSGVLLPLLVMILSVIWTFGFLALCGGTLNLVSAIIPVLVVIAGISDAIHLILNYYEVYGEVSDRRRALVRTIEENGVACFLTSATTAVGFFTLATTDMPLLVDFGIFTGTGILFAWFISLVVIPICLSFLAPPAAERREEMDTGALASFLQWVPRFVDRRKGSVALVALAVLAAFGLGIGRIEIEAKLLDDLPLDHPVLATNRLIEDRLGGIFSLEYIVEGRTEDVVKEPEFLRQVAALQRYLDSFPETGKVLSVVDYIKDLRHSFYGERDAERRIPDTREETAQLLFLYDISKKKPLEGFVDHAYRRARISAKIHDVGTHGTMRVLRAVDDWIRRFAPDEIRVRVTGLVSLAQKVNEFVVWNMTTSFLLDFLIIGATFLVLTRSFRLALVGLIPNVVPLAVTLGVMGWLGIALKPTSAIIFGITFGIAVDDTVHALARYRLEFAKDGDLLKAVERTFRGEGRATIFFSIILSLGFSILLFSQFRANQYFGFLCGVTIVAGLLGELFLLPWSLLVLRPRLAFTPPPPKAQAAPPPKPKPKPKPGEGAGEGAGANGGRTRARRNPGRGK
ncbi:MAG: MMPL family transporter [Planctomycetes bacterium]|nr:MMPL family transporter [Planctomycetota bacterium]